MRPFIHRDQAERRHAREALSAGHAAAYALAFLIAVLPLASLAYYQIWPLAFRFIEYIRSL